VDGGEGRGQILGERPFNLSDEAEGQVEIILGNPAKLRSIVHCVDQQVANRFRRANGGEQAVHGLRLTQKPCVASRLLA
jgi:hypothetical protein